MHLLKLQFNHNRIAIAIIKTDILSFIWRIIMRSWNFRPKTFNFSFVNFFDVKIIFGKWNIFFVTRDEMNKRTVYWTQQNNNNNHVDAKKKVVISFNIEQHNKWFDGLNNGNCKHIQKFLSKKTGFLIVNSGLKNTSWLLCHLN